MISGAGSRRSEPNSAAPAPTSVMADISVARSISPPSDLVGAAPRGAGEVRQVVLGDSLRVERRL